MMKIIQIFMLGSILGEHSESSIIEENYQSRTELKKYVRGFKDINHPILSNESVHNAKTPIVHNNNLIITKYGRGYRERRNALNRRLKKSNFKRRRSRSEKKSNEGVTGEEYNTDEESEDENNTSETEEESEDENSTSETEEEEEEVESRFMGRKRKRHCPDDGFFPDISSCASYRLCVNGVSYQFLCPRHFVYSHLKAACIEQGTESKCFTFNCKRKGNRKVPYGGDGRIYASCHMNRPRKMFRCPEGHVFYEKVQGCFFRCDEGFVEDPDDCAQFYKCNGHSPPTKHRCPALTRFDVESAKCTGRNLQKCPKVVVPKTDHRLHPGGVTSARPDNELTNGSSTNKGTYYDLNRTSTVPISSAIAPLLSPTVTPKKYYYSNSINIDEPSDTKLTTFIRTDAPLRPTEKKSLQSSLSSTLTSPTLLNNTVKDHEANEDTGGFARTSQYKLTTPEEEIKGESSQFNHNINNEFEIFGSASTFLESVTVNMPRATSEHRNISQFSNAKMISNDNSDKSIHGVYQDKKIPAKNNTFLDDATLSYNTLSNHDRIELGNAKTDKSDEKRSSGITEKMAIALTTLEESSFFPFQAVDESRYEAPTTPLSVDNLNNVTSVIAKSDSNNPLAPDINSTEAEDTTHKNEKESISEGQKIFSSHKDNIDKGLSIGNDPFTGEVTKTNTDSIYSGNSKSAVNKQTPLPDTSRSQTNKIHYTILSNPSSTIKALMYSYGATEDISSSIKDRTRLTSSYDSAARRPTTVFENLLPVTLEDSETIDGQEKEISDNRLPFTSSTSILKEVESTHNSRHRSTDKLLLTPAFNTEGTEYTPNHNTESMNITRIRNSEKKSSSEEDGAVVTSVIKDGSGERFKTEGSTSSAYAIREPSSRGGTWSTEHYRESTRLFGEGVLNAEGKEIRLGTYYTVALNIGLGRTDPLLPFISNKNPHSTIKQEVKTGSNISVHEITSESKNKPFYFNDILNNEVSGKKGRITIDDWYAVTISKGGTKFIDNIKVPSGQEINSNNEAITGNYENYTVDHVTDSSKFISEIKPTASLRQMNDSKNSTLVNSVIKNDLSAQTLAFSGFSTAASDTLIYDTVETKSPTIFMENIKIEETGFRNGSYPEDKIKKGGEIEYQHSKTTKSVTIPESQNHSKIDHGEEAIIPLTLGSEEVVQSTRRDPVFDPRVTTGDKDLMAAASSRPFVSNNDPPPDGASGLVSAPICAGATSIGSFYDPTRAGGVYQSTVTTPPPLSNANKRLSTDGLQATSTYNVNSDYLPASQDPRSYTTGYTVDQLMSGPESEIRGKGILYTESDKNTFSTDRKTYITSTSQINSNLYEFKVTGAAENITLRKTESNTIPNITINKSFDGDRNSSTNYENKEISFQSHNTAIKTSSDTTHYRYSSPLSDITVSKSLTDLKGISSGGMSTKTYFEQRLSSDSNDNIIGVQKTSIIGVSTGNSVTYQTNFEIEDDSRSAAATEEKTDTDSATSSEKECLVFTISDINARNIDNLKISKYLGGQPYTTPIFADRIGDETKNISTPLQNPMNPITNRPTEVNSRTFKIGERGDLENNSNLSTTIDIYSTTEKYYLKGLFTNVFDDSQAPTERSVSFSNHSKLVPSTYLYDKYDSTNSGITTEESSEVFSNTPITIATQLEISSNDKSTISMSEIPVTDQYLTSEDNKDDILENSTLSEAFVNDLSPSAFTRSTTPVKVEGNIIVVGNSDMATVAASSSTTKSFNLQPIKNDEIDSNREKFKTTSANFFGDLQKTFGPTEASNPPVPVRYSPQLENNDRAGTPKLSTNSATNTRFGVPEDSISRNLNSTDLKMTESSRDITPRTRTVGTRPYPTPTVDPRPHVRSPSRKDNRT